MEHPEADPWYQVAISITSSMHIHDWLMVFILLLFGTEVYVEYPLPKNILFCSLELIALAHLSIIWFYRSMDVLYCDVAFYRVAIPRALI